MKFFFLYVLVLFAFSCGKRSIITAYQCLRKNDLVKPSLIFFIRTQPAAVVLCRHGEEKMPDGDALSEQQQQRDRRLERLYCLAQIRKVGQKILF